MHQVSEMFILLFFTLLRDVQTFRTVSFLTYRVQMHFIWLRPSKKHLNLCLAMAGMDEVFQIIYWVLSLTIKCMYIISLLKLTTDTYVSLT